jgi:hypothetical protein
MAVRGRAHEPKDDEEEEDEGVGAIEHDWPLEREMTPARMVSRGGGSGP